uniref:Uncharacterized protein n=1 Tax=Chromera velia CCMP2878 TaxID=1169474 RepID=A0A0G4GX66_9ALVE|eukprot:Cvel_5355.t1-p1 / transcript=Cvel_5355.t1 / gene=Cvel_5355 / organism=Chromera_velia_CCMP2878 / gene_product=Myosin heavy chain, striated muscle, putative / transcript_product=Myosin heavy chain, striated muscle, putative / location=Cvel_scaffold248:70529-100514(+) / protein_length=2154 / sequence_SO=supercontig / SO=protein_coding / is_pseudo=false
MAATTPSILAQAVLWRTEAFLAEQGFAASDPFCSERPATKGTRPLSPLSSLEPPPRLSRGPGVPEENPREGGTNSTGTNNPPLAFLEQTAPVSSSSLSEADERRGEAVWKMGRSKADPAFPSESAMRASRQSFAELENLPTVHLRETKLRKPVQMLPLPPPSENFLEALHAETVGVAQPSGGGLVSQLLAAGPDPTPSSTSSADGPPSEFVQLSDVGSHENFFNWRMNQQHFPQLLDRAMRDWRRAVSNVHAGIRMLKEVDVRWPNHLVDIVYQLRVPLANFAEEDWRTNSAVGLPSLGPLNCNQLMGALLEQLGAMAQRYVEVHETLRNELGDKTPMPSSAKETLKWGEHEWLPYSRDEPGLSVLQKSNILAHNDAPEPAPAFNSADKEGDALSSGFSHALHRGLDDSSTLQGGKRPLLRISVAKSLTEAENEVGREATRQRGGLPEESYDVQRDRRGAFPSSDDVATGRMKTDFSDLESRIARLEAAKGIQSPNSRKESELMKRLERLEASLKADQGGGGGKKDKRTWVDVTDSDRENEMMEGTGRGKGTVIARPFNSKMQPGVTRHESLDVELSGLHHDLHVHSFPDDPDGSYQTLADKIGRMEERLRHLSMQSSDNVRFEDKLRDYREGKEKAGLKDLVDRQPQKTTDVVSNLDGYVSGRKGVVSQVQELLKPHKSLEDGTVSAEAVKRSLDETKIALDALKEAKEETAGGNTTRSESKVNQSLEENSDSLPTEAKDAAVKAKELLEEETPVHSHKSQRDRVDKLQERVDAMSAAIDELRNAPRSTHDQLLVTHSKLQLGYASLEKKLQELLEDHDKLKEQLKDREDIELARNGQHIDEVGKLRDKMEEIRSRLDDQIKDVSIAHSRLKSRDEVLRRKMQNNTEVDSADESGSLKYPKHAKRVKWRDTDRIPLDDTEDSEVYMATQPFTSSLEIAQGASSSLPSPHSPHSSSIHPHSQSPRLEKENKSDPKTAHTGVSSWFASLISPLKSVFNTRHNPTAVSFLQDSPWRSVSSLSGTPSFLDVSPSLDSSDDSTRHTITRVESPEVAPEKRGENPSAKKEKEQRMPARNHHRRHKVILEHKMNILVKTMERIIREGDNGIAAQGQRRRYETVRAKFLAGNTAPDDLSPHSPLLPATARSKRKNLSKPRKAEMQEGFDEDSDSILPGGELEEEEEDQIRRKENAGTFLGVLSSLFRSLGKSPNGKAPPSLEDTQKGHPPSSKTWGSPPKGVKRPTGDPPRLSEQEDEEEDEVTRGSRLADLEDRVARMEASRGITHRTEGEAAENKHIRGLFDRLSKLDGVIVNNTQLLGVDTGGWNSKTMSGGRAGGTMYQHSADTGGGHYGLHLPEDTDSTYADMAEKVEQMEAHLRRLERNQRNAKKKAFGPHEGELTPVVKRDVDNFVRGVDVRSAPRDLQTDLEKHHQEEGQEILGMFDDFIQSRRRGGKAVAETCENHAGLSSVRTSAQALEQSADRASGLLEKVKGPSAKITKFERDHPGVSPPEDLMAEFDEAMGKLHKEGFMEITDKEEQLQSKIAEANKGSSLDAEKEALKKVKIDLDQMDLSDELGETEGMLEKGERSISPKVFSVPSLLSFFFPAQPHKRDTTPTKQQSSFRDNAASAAAIPLSLPLSLSLLELEQQQQQREKETETDKQQQTQKDTLTQVSSLPPGDPLGRSLEDFRYRRELDPAKVLPKLEDFSQYLRDGLDVIVAALQNEERALDVIAITWPARNRMLLTDLMNSRDATLSSLEKELAAVIIDTKQMVHYVKVLSTFRGLSANDLNLLPMKEWIAEFAQIDRTQQLPSSKQSFRVLTTDGSSKDPMTVSRIPVVKGADPADREDPNWNHGDTQNNFIGPGRTFDEAVKYNPQLFQPDLPGNLGRIDEEEYRVDFNFCHIQNLGPDRPKTQNLKPASDEKKRETHWALSVPFKKTLPNNQMSPPSFNSSSSPRNMMVTADDLKQLGGMSGDRGFGFTDVSERHGGSTPELSSDEKGKSAPNNSTSPSAPSESIGRAQETADREEKNRRATSQEEGEGGHEAYLETVKSLKRRLGRNRDHEGEGGDGDRASGQEGSNSLVTDTEKILGTASSGEGLARRLRGAFSSSSSSFSHGRHSERNREGADRETEAENSENSSDDGLGKWFPTSEQLPENPPW